jgi:hypothetical protein
MAATTTSSNSDSGKPPWPCRRNCIMAATTTATPKRATIPNQSHATVSDVGVDQGTPILGDTIRPAAPSGTDQERLLALLWEDRVASRVRIAQLEDRIERLMARLLETHTQ